MSEKQLTTMDETKKDKYLTEMKELPPSYSVDEDQKEKIIQQKTDKGSDMSLQKEETPPIQVKKQEAKPVEEVSDLDELNVKERKNPLTYKDIILGIVNLASIVFFVIILINFPGKSQELRELKISEIRNNTIVGLEASEIEAARPKFDLLSKLYLDESGVVDFVNDVELQKTEGGAISKVTFASQKAVVDRTGNFGIPIVIELIGSWQSISDDLQKIDKLPYLLRPVKVDVAYDENDPQVIIYKYGIFLYVRESLGQTR